MAYIVTMLFAIFRCSCSIYIIKYIYLRDLRLKYWSQLIIYMIRNLCLVIFTCSANPSTYLPEVWLPVFVPVFVSFAILRTLFIQNLNSFRTFKMSKFFSIILAITWFTFFFKSCTY